MRACKMDARLFKGERMSRTLITRIFFGILANAGASMIIILAIIFGLILMWCDENKAAVQ